MWNVNFQMFKLDLEKSEEPEIKLPTSIGSSKKQESSRKTSTSTLLTVPKPLAVWITTNYGKFFERWEYQTTLPAPEKPACRSRSKIRTGHGATDWFQIGKGVHQGSTLSPCLFTLHPTTYMQSTSFKIPAWMKHKLESRLLGEISINSDVQMTSPLWQKAEKN